MRANSVGRWPILLVLICLGTVLSAQTPEITGQVVDPTGAAIPNARVLLIDTDTLDTQVVTTDSTGRFSFRNLARDAYEIKAKSPGFFTHTENVDYFAAPRGNVVVVKEAVKTRLADGSVAAESKPSNTLTLRIMLKIGHT